MMMGIKWNSYELKVRIKISLAVLGSSMATSRTKLLHCLGKATMCTAERYLSLHHCAQSS